jgi:Family of unknown function (DUF6080)
MVKRAWQSIKELLSLFLPTTLPELAVVLVSFCYFLACSIYINNLIPRDHQVEILGFDYSTYLRQLSDLDTVTSFPFRHPFLGVVLSPFIIIGYLINTLSVTVYHYYVCVLFSACVSLSVMLCFKIQRDILQVRLSEAIIGCFLFLSFGYMPILASVPESFSISMLILTVTLYMGGRQIVLGKSHSAVQWLTIFLLSGGTTITNAIKVALAFVISNSFNKKQFIHLVFASLFIVLLGFSGFYLRMAQYNAAHPEAPKTIMRSLNQTCYWIHTDLSAADKIDIATARFFNEPIVFHGNLLRHHEIPLSYENPLSRFLVGALYGLVLLSLTLNWKSKFTWLMLSLFSVDVLIHLVIFWGTVEGHLFCGHWFFILPICLTHSLTKLKNERLRLCYCIVLIMLASCILSTNLNLLLRASY